VFSDELEDDAGYDDEYEEEAISPEEQRMFDFECIS
jgi:hypothetical protein